MVALTAATLVAMLVDVRPTTADSVRKCTALLAGEGRETSRVWAVAYLRRHSAELPVAAAFDALVTAAGSDPVPAVRASAIATLGTLCTVLRRPLPDAVRRALTDTNEHVFTTAHELLRTEKPLPPKSVAAVIAVAESNDPERRWGAYFTLCWHGRHDPTAVAALRRGVADPNPKVQRAARLGLTYVTDELDGTVQFILKYHALAPSIHGLPADATPADQDAAYFRAVASFSDFAVLRPMLREKAGESVRILTAMLAGDRDSRLAAVWYLDNEPKSDNPLFTPAVRARLAKLVASDPDPGVRYHAYRALGLPPAW